MDEEHYDTPWEFLRPQSMRLSAAGLGGFSPAGQCAMQQPRSPTAASSSPTFHGQLSPSMSSSPHSPHSLPHSPSAGRLVHIGNQPIVEMKRGSLRLEKDSKGRFRLELRDEEDTLLEKGVDRVEAEKRLEGGAAGDFLLRARPDGGAALSLKGSRGALHIKLERRGERWVVGEGPCFRTISSAIHYYRRHPLPIRGADHLLLNRSLSHIPQAHF